MLVKTRLPQQVSTDCSDCLPQQPFDDCQDIGFFKKKERGDT